MKRGGVPYAGFFLVALLLHAGVFLGVGALFHPIPEFTVSAGDSLQLSLVQAPVPTAAPAASEPEPPVPPEPAPEVPPAPAPSPEQQPEAKPVPEAMAPPQPPPAKPRPVARAHAAHRTSLPARTTSAAPAGLAAMAGAGNPGAAVKARPDYFSNPAPPYPPQSRLNKEQGLVLLHVTVNARGAPDSVSISRSSGYPLLDQAALQAVRRWRFSPGRVGGIAVSSEVTIPVRFRLDRG